MKTVTMPVEEVKICFDTNEINNILSRMDNDPAIAPKGIEQIKFYGQIAEVLQKHGEIMSIKVEREVRVPDDEPVAPVRAATEVPVNGETVWENTESDDAVDADEVQSADQSE